LDQLDLTTGGRVEGVGDVAALGAGECGAAGAAPHGVHRLLGGTRSRSRRVTASTASGSSANSSARAAAYDTAPSWSASSLTRTVGWWSSLSATRRTVC